MSPIQTVETEVYASNHQFYVVDSDAGQTGEVWDGGGLERHLGVGDGIVAVGTIGYCDVPVRLELWDEAPPPDFDEWDHAAEATFELPPGRVGLSCVGGPAELEPLSVAPGTYRLRSCAARARRRRRDGRRRPIPGSALARFTERARGHQVVAAMRWVSSLGGDNLHVDDEGMFWEWRNADAGFGTSQLRELTPDEAREKYGIGG